MEGANKSYVTKAESFNLLILIDLYSNQLMRRGLISKLPKSNNVG